MILVTAGIMSVESVKQQSQKTIVNCINKIDQRDYDHCQTTVA